MRKHLESEAIEALRDTLRQVSVIKVLEITAEIHGPRGEKMVMGHIEINCHPHLLACRIMPNSDAARVKKALQDLHSIHQRPGAKTVPILIAPVLSEQAQCLCRESGVGFLDLEGNARLYLDEVFIVKRSLPQRKGLPPQAEPLPKSEAARFAQVA